MGWRQGLIDGVTQEVVLEFGLEAERDSSHQKDFKPSLPSHRNLLQSECNEQRETEILSWRAEPVLASFQPPGLLRSSSEADIH